MKATPSCSEMVNLPNQKASSYLHRTLFSTLLCELITIFLRDQNTRQWMASLDTSFRGLS